MNRIWHNYPSLIRCLRVFYILVYAYLLSRCYCYNHYKTPKILLLLPLLLLPLPLLSYYFATKYFATDIKFPVVVELTTQLLILENILWLPLCRINKFGLNTLPSKIVAIPYTCGLSVHAKHVTQCFFIIDPINPSRVVVRRSKRSIARMDGVANDEDRKSVV